jgi:hypothetical protein
MILNRRLKGSIDAYYRFTEDLITNRAVPSSTGRTRLAYNSGEMISQGVEGSIQWTVVDTRDWMFRIGANFGRNINWVVLADKDALSSREQLDMLLSGNLAVEGASVGALYSFRFAGLSPENGHPLFYAEDGERLVHMGVPVLFDLVYSGSTFPTLYGGFDFNVQYKRSLTLTFAFTYNFGSVKRLPSIFEGSDRSALDPMRNFSTQLLNTWRQSGDERHTNIPVLSDGSVVFADSLNIRALDLTSTNRPLWFYDRSDLRVARADFLKLRSIRLAYTLPKNVIERLRMSDVRLNFQINNVFTIADRAWAGVDPESANARIPNLPAFTAGVAIVF